MSLREWSIKLLDRLESEELKLLTWGYVQGQFNRDELELYADKVLEDDAEGLLGSQLVEDLLQRKLLIENPFVKGKYRTRFAEAVRLFSGLRQILYPDSWQTAPRLVTDFRVDTKPRTYPRRHVNPPSAIEGIQAGSVPLSTLENRVLKKLLEGKERELQLATFQVEANKQIRDAIRSGDSRGIIVTAGTGTGKTRAFYHPALMSLASRMDDEPWTQAVAIYPRNVLLADQLTEALALAKSIRSELKRPIRLGAFFGDTPFGRAYEPSWPKATTGYICPYLKCPLCSGELLWSDKDFKAGNERLRCTEEGCEGKTEPGELILTRSRMQQEPPDLLFTSTEMLNRQITDTYARKIFGIGQSSTKLPYLVLLDEVHTYGSSHGALVARLLRRWQRALKYKSKITWVGLSATLADAESFFCGMTGLSSNSVLRVDGNTDLVSEGREYRLVLRSDPASGAGTLSTSIQASMLLARILDASDISEGVFPPRLFVFTDDLDVTNRMFHDVLDAEGRFADGTPNFRKRPLASYRAPFESQPDDRYVAGQHWQLAEEVGNHLYRDSRLKVSRTSSQDAGVDTTTKVIVATSSLEVGFDDVNVGAVLQHKSPREAASFLQRKGRAGRSRTARPWTVVVLSDYGRDRVMFQGWEHLFDPTLRRPSLPIDSRYVLKISAAFALMDWLGSKVSTPGSTWRDLSRYPEGEAASAKNTRYRQDVTQRLLERLVDPEEMDLREELSGYLQSSLRVGSDEATALMWEPPRALVPAVVPTLLRRLERQWKAFGSEKPNSDGNPGKVPMPEFVPSSLFADLNVPEVRVLQESSRPQDATVEMNGVGYREDWMPIEQALSQTSVGRVTRRFSPFQGGRAHWAPPNSYDDHRLEVREVFDGDLLGEFQYTENGTPVSIPSLRLRTVRLAIAPNDVRHSSNAEPKWQSQIFATTSGDPGDVPSPGPFSGLIRRLKFHTHNNNSPVNVRRFTTGSRVSLKFGSPVQESRFDVDYTEGGAPVALGYELTVDGVLFGVKISPDHLQEVRQGKSLRALRIGFFRERLLTDPSLLAIADTFLLDWMAQVFVAMAVARARRADKSLPEAIADLAETKDWARYVRAVIVTIFQVPDIPPTDVDDDAPLPDINVPDRSLLGRMEKLVQVPEARTRILEHAEVLVREPDDSWDKFTRKQLKLSLAGVLLRACGATVENADSEGLIADVESGPLPPHGKDELLPDEEPLWITETMLGGGGLIEQLQSIYARDPRRFYMMAESAVLPGDLELSDFNLSYTAKLAVEDADVRSTIARLRESPTFGELQENLIQTRKVLSDHNILVTHPFFVSLNARLLRPNTSSRTDELAYDMLRHWEESESEYGIELDARVFAYLAAHDESIKKTLTEVTLAATGQDPTITELFKIIYSSIWPRGAIVRRPALDFYNRFMRAGQPDPLCLRALLNSGEQIDLEEPDWRQKAEDQLRSGGRASLFARSEMRGALEQAILEFVTEPMEDGLLNVHPYVARLERSIQGFEATLHLREALQ